MTTRGEAAGRRVEQSNWFDHVARVGLVAYGVVHLLLAWVALQLAWGESKRAPDSKGALHELASQPFGGALVWAVALGLVALVLWRVVEAAFGFSELADRERLKKRASSAARAVLYGAMAITALKVALGAGSDNSPTLTSRLLDLPFGRWLLGAVGLGVIAYGGATAWQGWQEKFMKHLDADGSSGDSGTAYRWFGKIGYLAKGFSIVLVGGLFSYAAVTKDRSEGEGMDAALRNLLQQPFGPWLLSIVAIGIGGYGRFCFARARHLDR